MDNLQVNFSLKTISRIGGVLYLIIIAAGIFTELYVRGSLVVWGDAAATFNNIAASPLLWRTGIAFDIIMHVCDVPLMIIFYILLRPVNKNLALVTVLFNLVQSAVMVATKLNLFTPLFLSGKAEYLKAFEPGQLQALSYISIRSDGYGFGVGLIFFGFSCLVMGYLIFKSGYIPKVIGILMQIAGLCYLINSFALILAPPLANRLTPFILVPCFIGELTFCLWLLIKGVKTGTST